MAYSFLETEEDEIKILRLLHGEEVVMEILPDHGAVLNRLLLQFDEKYVEVIDGYKDYKEVPNLPGSKSAILFPFPNRLKDGKYRYEGVEYQFPTQEEHHGNAIHGFVKDEVFKVEDFSVNDTGGEANLVFFYGGDRQYYPFRFAFHITYKYSGNELSTHFQIENRGNTHMPAGLGWHPYFTFDHAPISEIEMKLPFVSQVELDDVNLPTGKVIDFQEHESFNTLGDSKFDDCFKLIMQDKSALFLPEKKLGLALEPSKEFLFLQVYTPGDRKSIAIEPMNCNVNAFNNQEGLMDLEKGSSFLASFIIRTMDEEEYLEIKEDFED